MGGERFGEAEHPGPDPDGPWVADAAQEGQEGEWLPPWERWSRPVWHPAEDGRPPWVELVPPHLEQVVRDEIRGVKWEDEELEKYLQSCEVEAGVREAVDGAEAASRAREWQKMQEELHDMGIRPPVVDEPEPRPEQREGPPQVLSISEPPSHPVRQRHGTAGEAEADRSKRRKRRLRPLVIARGEGEPGLEEEEEEAAPPVETAEVQAGAAPPRQQRGREHRPRGGRGGRGRRADPGVQEIVTFNGSGKPQCLAALAALAPERGNVAAVVLQEHHAQRADVPDLQAAAKAEGWKLAAAGATEGAGGGASAGVAVVVPSHRPWGCPYGQRWDYSPRGSPGRLAAMWVQSTAGSGILIITMYWWTNEGASPRNVALLETALALAQSFGGLWVLGGDFNVPPPLLVSAAGRMLDRAGAIIKAPEAPTNYPGRGEARTLDYFVIDARLGPAVAGVELKQAVAGNPHRAVSLSIRAGILGGLVRTVRRPRMPPQARPVGCPRMPVVPARAEEGTREGEEEGLAAAWEKVAYCVEAEICRECDLVEANGMPGPAHAGRGRGLRLGWLPLLPPRIAAGLGRIDAATHRWKWVLNRVEELLHLCRVAARGSGLASGQTGQWRRIVYALGRRDGCVERMEEPLRSEVRALTATLTEPGGGEEGLRRVEDGLRKAITMKREQLAAERRATWRTWVSSQIALGGGALHRFVKRKEETPDELVYVDGEPSGSLQDHVESDRAEWEAVWRRMEGLAAAPWREMEEDLGAPLPELKPMELRRASRRFHPCTGIGADLFRPHWFAWLSDPLLVVIAKLFGRIEAEGRWPGQLMVTMVHLIPKESGGRRPIGLVASLVRLWERARVPAIQEWRSRTMRPYNWAAPGRSAEEAVWEQSVLDEAAASRGDVSASTLVDLAKAFEHIPLQLLWDRGRSHGFPLVLLRLILELCAAPRRLVYKMAVSEPVYTLTAVIAGLVSSIDLMFLLLIDVMDGLAARFPMVRLTAYVDDITMHRTGREGEVALEIRRATEWCVGALEGSCNLVVSREKTVTVGATRALRRRMAKAMGRLGIRMVKKARHLGVDYFPGTERGERREVQGKRWRAVRARRKRVRGLGRRGGPHVAATGIAPSASYGASVTGPSNGLVRSLGSTIADTYGKMGGRSVWARLGVRGADRRVDLILKPVRAWVEAVWRRRLPVATMVEAWRYAQRKAGLSTAPHRAAHGAARSFIAALARLGWQSPSFDSVLTRTRKLLRVGEVDVVTLMRFAVDDLAVQMALASSVARDINDLTGETGYYRALPGAADGAVNLQTGGAAFHVAGSRPNEADSARIWRAGRYQLQGDRAIPWLLPAQMVLKRRLRDHRLCTAADRSTAALLEGGWWTPSRLAAAGLREEPGCAACAMAPGTLFHRLGECSSSRQEREGARGCPPWLLRKARAQLWDPLFARGVPALPRVPPSPPDQVQYVYTDPGQTRQALTVSGDVYTDGALSGRWRQIARGGWGVAVLRPDRDEVEWAMHGTCAEDYPSVVRAELQAVLQALRLALPPLCLHIDNAEVVEGLQRGREWCTAPNRDGAEVWQRIWFYLDELGGGVTHRKVKAHTAVEDIELGVVTKRDRVGNEAADAQAKAGARLAERLSPTLAPRLELVKAIRWLYWARRYVATWSADIEDDDRDGRLPRPAAEEAGPRGRQPVGLRHLIWERGLHWLCRRCGREAQVEQRRRHLRSSRCLGSAAGRLLQRACEDPEAVSRCCAHSKRDLLGRGWRARTLADAEEDDGAAEPSGPFEESHGLEGEEEGGYVWGREDEERREAEDEERGVEAAGMEEAGEVGEEDSRGQWAAVPGNTGGTGEGGSGISGSSTGTPGGSGGAQAVGVTEREAHAREVPATKAGTGASPERTKEKGAAVAAQSAAAAGVEGAGTSASSTSKAQPARFRRPGLARGPDPPVQPLQRSATGSTRAPSSASAAPPGAAAALAEGTAAHGALDAPAGKGARAGGASSSSRSAMAAPEAAAAARSAGASSSLQAALGGSSKRSLASASIPSASSAADSGPAVKTQRRAREIWEYDPPWLYLPHLRSRWEVDEEERRGITRDRSPTMDDDLTFSGGGKRRRLLQPTATPSASPSEAGLQPGVGGGPASADDGGGAEVTRPTWAGYDDPEVGGWEHEDLSPVSPWGAAAFEQPPSEEDEGPSTAVAAGGASQAAGDAAASSRQTHSRGEGRSATRSPRTATGAESGGQLRRRGTSQTGRGSGSGRRYTSAESDPVDASDGRGHSLFITGSVIWCGLCGRYAARRLGAALKRQCPGRADGAAATQLARLRAGRHPLTGRPLLI